MVHLNPSSALTSTPVKVAAGAPVNGRASLSRQRQDGDARGAGRLEFIFLPEADGPTLPAWMEVFADGFSGPRDLYGEHEDLAHIAAADVVLVCGRQAAPLKRAIAQIRSARLDMPVVACVLDGGEAEEADLLRSGFDDVFRSSIKALELDARVRSLAERAVVYRLRSYASQILSHRRRTKGQAHIFTQRESAIITLLQDNQGAIVPYGAILDKLALPPTKASLHLLQVVVSSLRHKVPEDWEIMAVNKRGYVLQLI